MARKYPQFSYLNQSSQSFLFTLSFSGDAQDKASHPRAITDSSSTRSNQIPNPIDFASKMISSCHLLILSTARVGGAHDQLSSLPSPDTLSPSILDLASSDSFPISPSIWSWPHSNFPIVFPSPSPLVSPPHPFLPSTVCPPTSLAIFSSPVTPWSFTPYSIHTPCSLKLPHDIMHFVIPHTSLVRYLAQSPVINILFLMEASWLVLFLFLFYPQHLVKCLTH